MRRGMGMGVPNPGTKVAPSLLAQVLALPDQPTLWLAPETIVESGGSITEWQPYQGTTITLEQTTGASQPAYVASEPTLGGLACVHRDTAPKWLQEKTTTGAIGNLTDCSIYFLESLPTLFSGKYHFSLVSLSGASYNIYPLANPSGTHLMGMYDSTGQRTATSALTGPAVRSYLFDAAGGNCELRENGVKLADVTYDGTLSMGGLKACVGFSTTLGGTGGKRAEVILVPALNDAATASLWEAYLADKGGL